MSGSTSQRSHFCEVVSEEVRVTLRTRQKGGWNGRSYKFAQCDQELCQYVDENEPPCPLRPAMFGPEAGTDPSDDRDDAIEAAPLTRPRYPFDGFG